MQAIVSNSTDCLNLFEKVLKDPKKWRPSYPLYIAEWRDSDDHTALHLAVEHNQLRTVEVCRVIYYWCMFSIFTSHKFQVIITYTKICLKGTKYDHMSPKFLDFTDNNKNTALHIAASRGYRDIVKVCIV